MLEETEGTCPFCWETIPLLVDISAGSCQYTEDCSVCCRPILISLTVRSEDDWSISLDPENG